MSMTPIRVRGKRNGARAEKWHAGKSRTSTREASPASSVRSSATGTTGFRPGSTASRKRKRRKRELSRLEQLPTEIVQDIFDYSANIDLPFASPSLQKQLSSAHVYMRLTSRLLEPVLGHTQELDCLQEGEERTCANDADLTTATRLLNSRFMTPELFVTWLDERPEMQSTECDGSTCDSWHDTHRWKQLKPSAGLLPPTKIFRAPFSEGKVNMLKIFTHQNDDIVREHPDYAAIVYEGASQAIEQGAKQVMGLMLREYCLRPDTELLRKAVIDHEWSKDIISLLLTRFEMIRRRDFTAYSEHGHDNYLTWRKRVKADIDHLDPVLWSWAEQNRDARDGIGEWLMGELKHWAD